MLRNQEQPATPEEIRAAALQFVRKITGFHKPSKANQPAFEQAIQEIALSSERLLLAVRAPQEKRSWNTESSNVHHR